MQRCGGSIYSHCEEGDWLHSDNIYHVGEGALLPDTRNPWVFAATEFWYLGRAATAMPTEFRSMFGGRGERVTHPPVLEADFRAWVPSNIDPGMSAMPRDIKEHGVNGLPIDDLTSAGCSRR